MIRPNSHNRTHTVYIFAVITALIATISALFAGCVHPAVPTRIHFTIPYDTEDDLVREPLPVGEVIWL